MSIYARLFTDKAYGLDIRRDKIELNIIDYCLSKKKPLLGICRGHQLLGIYHNLKFIMDVSSSAICHSPRSHKISLNTNEPAHSIRITEDMIDYFFGDESAYKMPRNTQEREVFRKVLKEPRKNQIWVNSFHHQAIAYDPAKNYKEEDINVFGVSSVDLSDEVKEIIKNYLKSKYENWNEKDLIYKKYDWE